MLLADAAVIFGAGVAAGAINAIGGGGTLIAYPVLLWVGRDPILASATSTLSLWPGSLAGAYALRRDLAGRRRLLAVLLPAAIVGGTLGAFLLLRTPSRVFGALVPYLVLAATLLIAWQHRLLRVATTGRPPGRARLFGLIAIQLVFSAYGGYFGAALGILILAGLGLYGFTDIHQRNAMKNLLAALTNIFAAWYFAAARAVAWNDAAFLCAGAVVGGYAGSKLGRRLSHRVAERLVLAIGLGATAALFLRAL